MASPKIVREAVRLFGEMFNRSPSDTLLSAYVAALADVPDDSFASAVASAMKECRFFPSVAELRERAGCGAVDGEEEGALVWGKVREAIRRVGGYCSPPDFGPAGNAALRCLGTWESVTGMEKRELDFKGKEFARLYATFRKRGVDGVQAERLIGMHEQQRLGMARKPEGDPTAIGADMARLLEGASDARD